MTLSDRLQRAKTERLIAAGYLTSEHALLPEPVIDVTTPEAAPESAVPPVTIEVMSSGLHVVADEPAEFAAAPDEDHPSSCPKCNTLGTLDMVDLVGHTMHLTCPSCGTMWQVAQPAGAPVNP